MSMFLVSGIFCNFLPKLMSASFVWRMGVIIRISSSISLLSSLLTPNELDIRFQELNYPEKLSSNKTSPRRPKIFMTVFLIQALETALTSNLCSKPSPWHWPGPWLAIPHVVVGDMTRKGGMRWHHVEYKEETQNRFATTKLFSFLARCLCGCWLGHFLWAVTGDILMETILIPPLTRALLWWQVSGPVRY